MLWLNLLFFILSCAVLVITSTILIKSLIKISHFLHVSEYVIAFILMSLATTIPELFVGISSALARNTALSLGNVIGSNIANIALVGGIMILIAKGIKIKTKKIEKDAFFLIPIVILPLILFFIGNSISRIDGIILLAVFFLYSLRILKRRKKFKKPLVLEEKVKRSEIVIYSALFVAFLVLLFLSARYIVKYATLLSVDFALPPIIIGLFLIALGTSIPELAFQSRAAQLGHGEMALGNLLGSVAINSTLVLGVTAIIWPITANFMLFFISALFMVFLTFLFATFLKSGSKLYVVEGIALLLFYIIFILIEFYFKGIIV